MSNSRLENAQDKAKNAMNEANKKIEELGNYTSLIYNRLKAIQDQFNLIRNKPSDLQFKCNKYEQIRSGWKQNVDKIEKDFETAKVKARVGGATGVGFGGAVVGLGPTAAMGIATTFGVASTGTAISSLSGAAATNAALAWLGGGALAAGGGGMAAGQALLALAGPIGWAIAGFSIIASICSIFDAKNEKERVEDIFCLISKRDEKKYNLAIVEINERIKRIIDESDKLKIALDRTKSFGIDYRSMTIEQQYELGSYVNFMNASTRLLVNPIRGLEPDYIEEDIKKGCDSADHHFCRYHTELMTSMCNLLSDIKLDDTDKRSLSKSLANNNDFLKTFNITKKEFVDNEIIKSTYKIMDRCSLSRAMRKAINEIDDEIDDNEYGLDDFRSLIDSRHRYFYL